MIAAFGDGYEISIQSSLVLDGLSEPEPDVVVAHGSWRDFVNGLPLDKVVLVAEISKTTRSVDLYTKAHLSAKANIPEYWVIDLVNGELVVHRQPAQKDGNWLYVQVQQLKKGQSLAPLHAPQTSIVVNDLIL